MRIQDQTTVLIANALRLAGETDSDKVFLFLNSEQSCKVLSNIELVKDESWNGVIVREALKKILGDES